MILNSKICKECFMIFLIAITSLSIEYIACTLFARPLWFLLLFGNKDIYIDENLNYLKGKLLYGLIGMFLLNIYILVIAMILFFIFFQIFAIFLIIISIYDAFSVTRNSIAGP